MYIIPTNCILNENLLLVFFFRSNKLNSSKGLFLFLEFLLFLFKVRNVYSFQFYIEQNLDLKKKNVIVDHALIACEKRNFYSF